MPGRPAAQHGRELQRGIGAEVEPQMRRISGYQFDGKRPDVSLSKLDSEEENHIQRTVMSLRNITYSRSDFSRKYSFFPSESTRSAYSNPLTESLAARVPLAMLRASPELEPHDFL